MTTIILPDRRLVEMPCLNLHQGIEVQEIYADGAKVFDQGEIMRVVFYVSAHGNGGPTANICIPMRRSGFELSLIAAAAEHLPRLLGEGRLM